VHQLELQLAKPKLAAQCEPEPQDARRLAEVPVLSQEDTALALLQKVWPGAHSVGLQAPDTHA